jgi:hypothetical protein
LFKKTAILSFAFMAIEVDTKISVQVFGGSDGCYFLKNHSSLFASKPPISHAAVDVQKRLGAWTKFPFHPMHTSTASDTITN